MNNFVLSDAAVEALARLLRSVPDEPASVPVTFANGKGMTRLLVFANPSGATDERKEV